jgi:hypothetical protein
MFHNGKKLTVSPRAKQESKEKFKMSAQKKKSSGCRSAPKGDGEPSLSPPIPFVPPKMDNDDETLTVDSVCVVPWD